MIRTCDGTDENLTRTIPACEFDPASMKLSPWTSSAPPGCVVINCQCGRTFDDADRMVLWPHEGLARAYGLVAYGLPKVLPPRDTAGGGREAG